MMCLYSWLLTFVTAGSSFHFGTHAGIWPYTVVWSFPQGKGKGACEGTLGGVKRGKSSV